MKTLQWMAVGLLTVVLMVSGCAFPGSRLLRMEIYQDDRLVLLSTFGAPDYERPEDFWRRAGAEPFSVDETVLKVKADGEHALHAHLSGMVRIKILHDGRRMTDVQLKDLDLTRSAAGSSRWYMTAAEVQRALRAAGL